MTWYWQRTVIYITNPSTSIGVQEGFIGDGSTTECLMDGMCRMHKLSLEFMAASDARHAGYFTQIRDLASHYMELARGQQRLQIMPSHVVNSEQVHNQYANPHEIQRDRNIPKGRQGGRRHKPRASQAEQQFDATPPVASGFTTGASEMYTPPAAASPIATQVSLLPSHPQVVHTEVPQPSISPIPFLDLSDTMMHNIINHSESNRAVLSDVNMVETSEEISQDHTVQVDEDVPLARRRSKRTIKHTTCGTHGKLGGQ